MACDAKGSQQLADERIKVLLSTTNMTFKQIVEQIRQESMKANLNDIRRVNKDNLYRKKRYDSKLTLQQRRELIRELLSPKRPNLSALAEKYGVCHGSIWYWSDKIERIRERNNGIIPDNHPIVAAPDDLVEQDYMSGDSGSGQSAGHPMDIQDTDEDDDIDVGEASNCSPDWDEQNCNPLNLTADHKRQSSSQRSTHTEDSSDNEYLIDTYPSLKLVGPVQALDLTGEYMKLPIMMYTQAAPKIDAWAYAYSTSGVQVQPIDATTSPGNNIPLCLRKIA